jgi:hypothetical protein
MVVVEAAEVARDDGWRLEIPEKFHPVGARNIAGTRILNETSISFRSFPEFFRSLMLIN